MAQSRPRRTPGPITAPAATRLPRPISAPGPTTALASIVQFTDLHLIDAQSTMRFEYMVELDSSAFRPHEALGTHAASQLLAKAGCEIWGG